MTAPDWLAAQLAAPGALIGLVQTLLLAAVAGLLWRTLRRDRVAAREAARREAVALASLADYACEHVIAVSDALTDEVAALEFVETMDLRTMVEAQAMLAALRPADLPSVALYRPLFELLGVLDVALREAHLMPRMMDDPEREGWRQAAATMRDCAERAAVAADQFQDYARSLRRG